MRGFGRKIPQLSFLKVLEITFFFIKHLNKIVYLERLENKLKLSGGRVQDEISETDAFNRFKHIFYYDTRKKSIHRFSSYQLLYIEHESMDYEKIKKTGIQKIL